MIIVKKFDQFLFLLFISDLKECSTSVNCQLTFQSHQTPQLGATGRSLHKFKVRGKCFVQERLRYPLSNPPVCLRTNTFYVTVVSQVM